MSPGSCREKHHPSHHDQEYRRAHIIIARRGYANNRKEAYRPLHGDGDGNNSNFTQIVHLRNEDNPVISTWLVMKTNKYTSWQIQNEMLKVMALEVLRDVPASLHSSPFYSIMAADTTDSSNREQVVSMGGQYFACS